MSALKKITPVILEVSRANSAMAGLRRCQSQGTVPGLGVGEGRRKGKEEG